MTYFGYINVPMMGTLNNFYVIKADTTSNVWEIERFCGEDEEKARKLAMELDNAEIGKNGRYE